MTTPLARITSSLDVPRGPDVKLRVKVERAWLAAGERLTVELPRNLACAACDGGGCDACDRAGAVSLRDRKDPPDVLELTVPTLREGAGANCMLTLRIPDRGGLARVADLPRGILLLTLSPADASDPGVQRVVDQAAPDSLPSESPLYGPQAQTAFPRRSSWLLAGLLGAITLLLLLFFLR